MMMMMMMMMMMGTLMCRTRGSKLQDALSVACGTDACSLLLMRCSLLLLQLMLFLLMLLLLQLQLHFFSFCKEKLQQQQRLQQQ